MTAVWFRARAELRGRWRAWVALAILIGVAGGISLAAAAGARRTSSSFDRLLAQSNAHDVEVQVVEDARETILDEVAALPQVLDGGRIGLFPAAAAEPGGDPEPFKWNVTAAALAGDAVTRDLDRARLVGGREMRFDEPHEAMVSEAFIRQRGIGIGDDFTIQLATWDEVFALFEGRFPVPTAPEATVRIVGVWKLPHDVSIAGEEQGLLYLSPAFFASYAPRAAVFEELRVRLRGGEDDVPSFIEDARALVRNPEALSFTTQADLSGDVARALDVMSIGLWIAAGLMGAVTLLVIGQSVSRAMAAGAADLVVLRQLAFTTSQRAAVALVPVVFASIGGSFVAVIAAVAASPALPLGFVREIEPSPGFSIDALVLGSGAVAVTVLMIARVSVPAVRLACAAGEQPPARATASLIATGAVRTGLPPAAVTGVRFALEPGRGSSAIPVRSTIGGIVAVMVAIVAAFSFGPSMDGLIDRPANFGWTFDVLVYGGEDEELVADQVAMLDGHPLAEAYTVVTTRTATLGDHGLQLIGFDPRRGGIEPAVIEGRPPRASDEIALGARAMRLHHGQLGDRIDLPAATCDGPPSCTIPFTIVGVAIPPPFDGAGLGEGSAVTMDGLERVRTTGGFTDYAVGLPDGADVEEARARFERDFGDAAVAIPPVELVNLDRVRALPDLLAAVLVVVALAVMAHALVTAVRRRRRDLAILKTLGFARAQVRAAVAWQATTLLALALVIGIPGGLAAGRWAWRFTVNRLGAASDPVTSVTQVALGAVSLLIAANLIAAWPGRRAARTEPALILRSE